MPAEYHEFAGMPHLFSMGKGGIQKTPEFRDSLKLTIDFLAKHAGKGTK